MIENAQMTRRAVVGVALLTSAILFALATFAGAQTATASLSGTVEDESRAAVPDVEIVAINSATGLQRSTKSSSEGSFTLQALPPGTYRLSAKREGFAPTEVDDVMLNVGDQVVLTLRLKIAALGETVNVVVEPPRSSTSPAVSTVVDRQFVENMPLNGRSFQSLIALAPGVVLSKTSFASQGQFSVNGQRPDANYFTVDGVSANIGTTAGTGLGQAAAGALPGLSAGGGTNSLVSIDALQEFTIQTSTFAPEYGRMPGAQIQMVTRSGTNEWRGTAFEYFRDDALDANDWFANRSGLERAPLRQHDFGAVVGGPIQPNRLFFFGSYEGLRVQQPQVTSTPVPSMTARQSAPSPFTRAFLHSFPLPNADDVGNGLALFNTSYANESVLDAASLRIDHVVSSGVNVFGRYNYSPTRMTARPTSNPSLLTNTAVDTQTATIGVTQVWGRRLLNDLRLNYSRVNGDAWYDLDTYGGATVPSATELFPTFAPAGSTVNYQTLSPILNIISGANAANRQVQWNLVESLSVTAGSHQLKMGFDYRRLSPSNGLPPYIINAFYNSIQDVLSDTASSVIVRTNDPAGRRFTFENMSAFIQDVWSLGRRVTLTYGLRWDVNPPPDFEGAEPFSIVNIDNPPAMALGSRGEPLFETRYGNVAPRVGMAWQPFDGGRSVSIRGGVGVFYDLGMGNVASSVALSTFPYTAQLTLANVPYSTDLAISPPPITFAVPTTSSVFAVDPSLKTPRTYQWNVTAEKPLNATQTVSASYVGAAGRDLIRQEAVFNPNPGFAVVSIIRNAARSQYHSMQLQYRSRLSRGFQALASYTLAESTDTSSTDAATATQIPVNRLSPDTDEGPSDFDVRHTFDAALTYELPRKPRASRLVASLLNDWSIDTRFTARSALAITPIVSRNLGFGNYSFRPDVVPGVPQWIEDETAPGGRRLNAAAFTTPGELRQGNLPRNSLRGFPMWQLDLAIRREIRVGGRARAQIRFECFNVLNHPNFADPQVSLNTLAQFGLSTNMLASSLGAGGVSGGLSPLYQVGRPRSTQLAVRFQF